MTKLPLVPEETHLVALVDEGREFLLHPDASHAWQSMKAEAMEANISLHLISAFRSVAYQQKIIDRKRARGIPDEEIFRVNTPAGYSEHHSGRAIDIGTIDSPQLEEEFEETLAYRWLSENAVKFGFRLSYPRDNPFGISYEPWHWRYSDSD